MIFIKFNKFGGGPLYHPKDVEEAFTFSEQMTLMRTVNDCVDCSEIAQKASANDFKGHHDKLKLWFGITPEKPGFLEALDIIKTGVNKIHATLIDNKKTIRFIDMRDQYNRFSEVKYIPTLHFPQSGLCGEGAFKFNMCSDFLGIQNVAGVHTLSRRFRFDNVTHVGSFLSVYIGMGMFLLGSGQDLQRHSIIHELTHKLLATDDFIAFHPINGLGKHPYYWSIYGRAKCQNLANISFNPIKDVLTISDNWAYFICSFLDLGLGQMWIDCDSSDYDTDTDTYTDTYTDTDNNTDTDTDTDTDNNTDNNTDTD